MADGSAVHRPTPRRVDEAALAAEAARLDDPLGPSPTADEGGTPQVVAWLDQYRAASAQVGDLAGWDARLLRRAAGPGFEGSRPGHRLLIQAAIQAERRFLAEALATIDRLVTEGRALEATVVDYARRVHEVTTAVRSHGGELSRYEELWELVDDLVIHLATAIESDTVNGRADWAAVEDRS
jgi:hypothetical protein